MARRSESFSAGGTEARPEEAGQGMREAFRGAESEVKERARDVKERVQERSREVRSEAERRADRWTSEMGEQIERVARALRTAGDALEDEGEGRLSAASMTAAEQAERMAEYLREENPGAMIRDLEGMARRNPGAFVGTTFVAGLLLGRFLRSTSPRERGGESQAGEDRVWENEEDASHSASAGRPAQEVERARADSPAGRGGAERPGSGGWEGNL